MVCVDGIQKPTLSAEAVAYLESHSPLEIPGPELTQQIADEINAQIEAVNGPILAQLQKSLSLQVQTLTIGGVPAVKITPAAIEPGRGLAAGFFAHGGGFAFMHAKDYTAYRMAHDLGIVVYSVDYSLSPRAKFPTALNETAAAYRHVAEHHQRIVVAGSSAGANLLITAIRTAPASHDGRPPEAAALFSPAVDLRVFGDSYLANDGRDPLLSRDSLNKIGPAYLGPADPADPDASPILADYLHGFVPTLISTGSRDLLESDSLRLYRRLRRADAQVRLSVWEGMWHGFESVPGIPESEQALRDAFNFLGDRL